MGSMAVIRAFIALDLASPVYARLEQVSARLRDRLHGVPMRWSQVNNIHLTLKFLGDVSATNLETLQKVLENEAGKHPPFTLSTGGLGAFPSPNRARVLWMGIQAPPDLAALQLGIEQEMARLGYAPEERPFSPHLTLGRVGRNVTPQDLRRIGEALKEEQTGDLGATRVEAVHLFKSDLRPEGSIYTRLFSASLGKPGQDARGQQ